MRASPYLFFFECNGSHSSIPKPGALLWRTTIFSPLLGSEASLSQANPLFRVPNMQDDGHINLCYEILQRNAGEPIERIFFTSQFLSSLYFPNARKGS